MSSKKTKLIDEMIRLNKSTFTLNEIKQIWWNLTEVHKTSFKRFNAICMHLNTTCVGACSVYNNSSYGYLTKPTKSDKRCIKRISKNTYIVTQ